MTFFAISCKFFFQILTYLEEKKKVQPLWLLRWHSTAIFKDTWGIYVSYSDSGADMSKVCFPASLRHTNVLIKANFNFAQCSLCKHTEALHDELQQRQLV